MITSQETLPASSAKQALQLNEQTWDTARLRHHLAMQGLIPWAAGFPSKRSETWSARQEERCRSSPPCS